MSRTTTHADYDQANKLVLVFVLGSKALLLLLVFICFSRLRFGQLLLKLMWNCYTHGYIHKEQPQHCELHALLFSNSLVGSHIEVMNMEGIGETGLWFIVLI